MSVSDRVHLVLRRRLMSGRYEPGARLKEETVAAELNVSRTPVRAAIQRLIAEGLLEAAPRRGALVTRWRREDAEEIFNLRILLEGRGAALSALAADEAHLDRMEALNARMTTAVRSSAEDRLDVVNKTNLAFHMAIYDGCGSPHLRSVGVRLLEYPLMIGGFYIYSDAEMEQSIRQHDEIVSALRARSPDWARAAVACHLAAAIERFRRAERQAEEVAENRYVVGRRAES